MPLTGLLRSRRCVARGGAVPGPRLSTPVKDADKGANLGVRRRPSRHDPKVIRLQASKCWSQAMDDILGTDVCPERKVMTM